jgi:hypothetical protein
LGADEVAYGDDGRALPDGQGSAGGTSYQLVNFEAKPIKVVFGITRL